MIALPLLAVLMHSTAWSAGSARAEEPALVVATDLPAPAVAVLEEIIRAAGVEPAPIVRTIAPDDVASMVAAGAGPLLFVGVPVAAFAPVLDRLVAIGEPPASAHLELSEPARRFLALWFDPVVVAGRSDRDAGDLPESYAELTRGRFEGRVFLAEPRPWNAAGQLVATFAIRATSRGAADRALEGLDANVVLPYLDADATTLARLDRAEQRSVAVVTRSTVLAMERAGSAEGRYTLLLPEGGPIAVIRGLAGARMDDALASRLARSFAPDAVARLAAAADFFALNAAEDETQDDPDLDAEHIAIDGNAEVLSRAQSESREVIDHFRTELRGRLNDRATKFSEIFDTLGILAMAVLVVVLVVRHRGRRGGAATPQD